MANRKPAQHPPMRTRKKAKAATIRKRRTVRQAEEDAADLAAAIEALADPVRFSDGQIREELGLERPDTDDPSQMMAAEAACGPLVDPILEDEDDSDDSPLDGGAPKR